MSRSGPAVSPRIAESDIDAEGDPGKLHHVGPVADAWAVNREANAARRSTQ